AEAGWRDEAVAPSATNTIHTFPKTERSDVTHRKCATGRRVRRFAPLSERKFIEVPAHRAGDLILSPQKHKPGALRHVGQRHFVFLPTGRSGQPNHDNFADIVPDRLKAGG
ncbi:MAG: hypothetical protein JXA15_13690, partial [Spirochaetales bacterium]|nr:hypothetical protein [Spirochaetales bacterium]